MQLQPRAPPNDPRPVQHGGGVELDPCSIQSTRTDFSASRSRLGGRLFTAKLAVVVHYLSHQLTSSASAGIDFV